MELSEVVSAHFAFPVVGVVLCAVLVFAFGFKSPVQPPSFDLLDDDDDRKYKKSRQKKHKLNIDGHVINIDGHGSPGAKTITKQQTTSNKQATNDKQDPQLSKVKTKKPKPVTETGVPNETAPEEEQDAGATGEWTKAVSKKDRKNRSKKDDVSKKDDFLAAAAAGATASAKAEKTSPSHEIQKAVQVTYPTVINRDEVYCNRTQRKTPEVTVTAPAPAPAPVLVSCTAVPAGSDAVSVNADSFSSKVKAAVVSVTAASTFQAEPQKLVVTSLEQTKKSSSPTCTPKLSQPTLGKGPEPVAANVVQLPVDDDDDKVLPLPAAVTACAKTLAEDKSDGVPIDSSASVTVGDSKPARSPKKKKKSPESREKFKESPVVTIPADVTASSVTLTAEPQVKVEQVIHDSATKGIQIHDSATKEIETDATRPACEAEFSTGSAQCNVQPSDNSSTERTCHTTSGSSLPVTDSQTTAGVAQTAIDTQPVGDSQPASDNQLDGDSQLSIHADELGDWQEAKPLKKKRKPHREN